MHKSYLIEEEKLPQYFPTHRHPPEFWESLGRTIATFGFLEEMLKKAIYAHRSIINITPITEKDYLKWLEKMEHTLTSQLGSLAEQFEKAVRSNPKAPTAGLKGLVDYIKEGVQIRNLLCHASWRTPNTQGNSKVFYIKKVF